MRGGGGACVIERERERESICPGQGVSALISQGEIMGGKFGCAIEKVPIWSVLLNR